MNLSSAIDSTFLQKKGDFGRPRDQGGSGFTVLYIGNLVHWWYSNTENDHYPPAIEP